MVPRPLRRVAGPGLVLLATALALAPARAFAERLGPDVVPNRESVRLVLDPAKAGYAGSVEVALTVRRPVTAFTFHAREMTLGRTVLRGPAGETVLTTAALPGGVVRATAAAPVAAGTYTLAVDFTNDFDTKATSLYRLQTGGEWYAFTQFEATDARGAFPCWDEPAFKIPYRMTLVVPQAHLAVSNTPVESETAKDGMKTVIFRETPPLPSYLLAIATGPLETIPIPGLSVPGRVVTVKGARGLAGAAAEVTPRIVQSLERYFGRPYPFAKLDLLAVPEFWPGAMENAGAVTFADGILLVDPKAASAGQRRTLVAVTAHELAHMWFGDLVTMAWWDDLWLNESFATWMEDKVGADAFPELALDRSSAQDTQSALNTDARRATQAIRKPIASDEEAFSGGASELTYQKGAAVLRMFETWVGPAAFQKGVRSYLAAHEWKSATAADLWSAVSEAAKRDVRGPMETFLDQPGVPLVTAELTDGGNKVRLTQSRFANAGASAPAPALWKIPVGIKYTDGQALFTQTVLLTGRTQEFKLDVPSPPMVWMHPNAGENGYYRWKVAPILLRQTAESARARLTERERIGFVGNLSALLDAGVLSGADYLRTLAPFGNDPAPEVVQAVMDQLAKVRRALVPRDLRPAFGAYVRQTLGPALDRIGLVRAAGEPEGVTNLRPGLLLWLGRDGGDARVEPVADALARSYLDLPTSVDASVAGVALELLARHGDRALFDALRAKFEKATVPAERRRYLSALAHFPDEAIAREALSYALTGPLRPQEVVSIPEGMLDSGEHGTLAFGWTLDHFGEVAKRLPPVYVSFAPQLALSGACTAERIDKAKAFFAEPAHVAPGTDAQLAMAAERAEDCARLRAREAGSVAAYLRTVAP